MPTLHSKRCNYQATIHGRALLQKMNAPSPDGHEWRLEDDLTVTWMTKWPAPDVLFECVSCTCAAGRCLKGWCWCLPECRPTMYWSMQCMSCRNFRDEDDPCFVVQGLYLYLDGLKGTSCSQIRLLQMEVDTCNLGILLTWWEMLLNCHCKSKQFSVKQLILL